MSIVARSRIRALVAEVAVLGWVMLAPSAHAQCSAPVTPTITRFPATVGAGQTYTVAWNETLTNPEDGYYEVERTLAGGSDVSRQVVSSGSSASFLTRGGSGGNFGIRVRAVPFCDPSKASAYSSAVTVAVGAGKASAVFTVQPSPVIVPLGGSTAGRKSSFVIENLTARDLADVSLSRVAATDFFVIRDPAGGDVAAMNLAPRVPKTLEIEILNVPSGTPAAHQGIILLSGPNNDPFAITTYAFVSLKIGDADSQPPEFTINGTPTEYAFLSGWPAGQSDIARPPLVVGIRNPGSTPLELGAEVGPELWLTPKAGWNANPIAPGGSVSVELATDRFKAPNGSSLPRYTYFTVRSRSGQSARLLVQDNDSAALDFARPQLGDTERSFVITDVVSQTLTGGQESYSRVRFSNASTDAINAELFLTPSGRSGFDPTQVKKAVVVVPANDEVTLTDPLRLIFGLTRPANGQIEVRVRSRATGANFFGNLTASSFVFTPSAEARGGYLYGIPVAIRGEGAQAGLPHVVSGITVDAPNVADLALAETTGNGAVFCKVALYDSEGVKRGTKELTIEPYGHARIANVVSALGGGASISAARLEIAVDSGDGRIVAVLIVTDPATGRGWSLVSEPARGVSPAKLASYPQQVHWPEVMRSKAQVVSTSKVVIPSVVTGFISTLQTYLYRTNLELQAPLGSPVTFTISLTTERGALVGSPQIVTLGAGKSRRWADVLKELFGVVDSLRGALFIESSNPDAKIVARLESQAAGTSVYRLAGTASVVGTASPATSGATVSARPIYLEGAEQSIDPTRGSRWMLVLNEIANAPATVLVRLYEPANRVLPIAEKTFTLGALQQVHLDSVFSQMGLDTSERRKDRANVLIVVQSIDGGGLLTATAIAQDNRTGSAQVYPLTPTGGVPAGRLAVPSPKPIPPVIRVIPRPRDPPVRVPPGSLGKGGKP